MAIPRCIDVPFRIAADGTAPATVEGVDLVLDRMIRTIILTMPGERPYRPTFGCWVKALVFTNMSEGAAFQAAAEVRRAIGAWENRVEVRDVLFEISDNKIMLNIVWRPNGRALDSTTTIEFVT